MLVVCGDEALQLLEPVEDDVDLACFLLILLDHQKSLSVRGNIVLLVIWVGQVVPCEQNLRAPLREGGLSLDAHDLKRTAVAIKTRYGLGVGV